jgi:hypothetical protein
VHGAVRPAGTADRTGRCRRARNRPRRRARRSRSHCCARQAGPFWPPEARTSRLWLNSRNSTKAMAATTTPQNERSSGCEGAVLFLSDMDDEGSLRGARRSVIRPRRGALTPRLRLHIHHILGRPRRRKLKQGI